MWNFLTPPPALTVTGQLTPSSHFNFGDFLSVTCDFLNELSGQKHGRTWTPGWGNIDLMFQRRVKCSVTCGDAGKTAAGCAAAQDVCHTSRSVSYTFRSVECHLCGISLAQILWELRVGGATCTLAGNSTAQDSETGDALVMLLGFYVF